MVPASAYPAAETLCDPRPITPNHRIDLAHPAPLQSGIAEPPERRQRLAEVVAQAATATDGGSWRADRSGESQRLERSAERRASCGGEDDYSVLRDAHAEDLIQHVQRLWEDLDARSAKLHADIALHEHRERSFRLWVQQRCQEIRSQQQACCEQQAKLQAQARRLAMTDGA